MLSHGQGMSKRLEKAAKQSAASESDGLFRIEDSRLAFGRFTAQADFIYLQSKTSELAARAMQPLVHRRSACNAHVCML